MALWGALLAFIFAGAVAEALTLNAAQSRKAHGAAGTFDLPIDATQSIGGPVTVEPRAIGAGHQIVFQFDVPIAAAGTAAATDENGTPVGTVSAAAAGNEVVVTLAGVPDNKRVTVHLSNVNGAGVDVFASLGFLVGDVNNSRSVTATDILQVKGRSGQVTNATNFTFDLNASGSITASDILAVKGRSGLVLPAALTVGGTISGLTGTVVLQNSGGSNFAVSIDGAFTFPSAVVNGSPYNVTVFTQPPSQNCAVGNGTGTISGASVGNVSVTCSIVTAESCNGRDDNGNGQIDEGLGTFSSGLGACRRTVAACTAGVLGVPLPGNPASETADGIDNNCNGAVDEAVGACLHVALTGSDTTGLGSAVLPFRTIQWAINFSAANLSAPKTVCVAAGPVCLTGGVTGTYSENVVMANGVSVHGGYVAVGTAWPLCTTAVTAIQPSVAEGVRFPASVVDPTTLFNFRIDRATTLTTSGVTIDGAQNVLLASVSMTNTPVVQRSYGVNVINGGQATVADSLIAGGTGSIETIGVRAVNSQVAVIRNCPTFDASGRCNVFGGTATLAIRGRQTTVPETGESYAVLLDNSPSSLVEESSLSTNNSDVGAAIRIIGNGAGIRIRANHISAFSSALDSHGIWAEDCADASPWIVNNSVITAAGRLSTSRSSGIRAIGSCHPVVEGNALISGGTQGQSAASIGVHCGKNASQVGSQCVIARNAQIAAGGGSVSSTGIFCEDGSCARIEGNGISNSLPAPDTYGVRLGRTGVRVEANTISAGCGANSSTGVMATGSRSRIANNFISGGFGCAVAPPVSRGLLVVNTGDPGEVDVHSNTITARGVLAACTSVALELDAATSSPPPAGKGIFRNNILHGGDCITRYGVRELAASADPRIFENNDIVPAGAASALYLNEATTALTTAAQVNALTDMTVANILALDPLFVTYPGNLRLQITSPLRAAGTAAGAPATDFFGQPRNPATPSIGADESP
jgi:hypothetical protein